MENKELIRRLVSFDDEDTSTGYVSAGEQSYRGLANGCRFLIWFYNYLNENGLSEDVSISLDGDDFDEQDLSFDIKDLNTDDEETLNNEHEGEYWLIKATVYAGIYGQGLVDLRAYSDDFSFDNSFGDFERFVESGGLIKETKNALMGPEEYNIVCWNQCLEDTEYDIDGVLDRLDMTYDDVIKKWGNGKEMYKNVADILYEKEVVEPVKDALIIMNKEFKEILEEYRKYCRVNRLVV